VSLSSGCCDCWFCSTFTGGSVLRSRSSAMILDGDSDVSFDFSSSIFTGLGLSCSSMILDEDFDASSGFCGLSCSSMILDEDFDASFGCCGFSYSSMILDEDFDTFSGCCGFSCSSSLWFSLGSVMLAPAISSKFWFSWITSMAT